MGERGPVARLSASEASHLRGEIANLVGSDREGGWIVDHVESVLRLDGPARDEAARRLARRRAAGEPLQYVLGRWAFRSLELDVDARVLIPRPETEQVVEVALRCLDEARARPERPAGPAVVCDLGTGSGAIALSLAAEARHPASGLEVWATDRSKDALAVARANRDGLADEGHLRSVTVELVEGDWFDALPRRLQGGVDLVVANPPYVSTAEHGRLDPSVRDAEPSGALVAADGRDGTPGLADVEAVVSAAPRWLRPTGSLVVEIAPHQAAAAVAVARTAGFRAVGLAPDLAGRTRMVVASC